MEDAMSGNIRCFAAGCENPIVGQCPGFKSEVTDNNGCGHFYCREHSKGNLCSSCAEEKASVEGFREYLAAAQDILQKRPRISKRFLYGFAALAILAVLTEDAEARGGRLGGVLGGIFMFALPFLIVFVVCKIRENAALRAAKERLPRFGEFFEMVRHDVVKEERSQAAATALGLAGAGAVGLASGVVQGAKTTMRDTANPALTGIQNSLDEIKRKL